VHRYVYKRYAGMKSQNYLIKINDTISTSCSIQKSQFHHSVTNKGL